MIVFAIKFDDETYYSGYGSYKIAKTLIGAQLYKTEQAAQKVIDKSVNFPHYLKDKCSIIKVRLEEYNETME